MSVRCIRQSGNNTSSLVCELIMQRDKTCREVGGVISCMFDFDPIENLLHRLQEANLLVGQQWVGSRKLIRVVLRFVRCIVDNGLDLQREVSGNCSVNEVPVLFAASLVQSADSRWEGVYILCSRFIRIVGRPLHNILIWL